MCFARPAPRCSKHAWEAMRDAATVLVEANRAVRADFTRENLDALDAAEARVRVAEEDYRTSLAGIRDARGAGLVEEAQLAEADRLRLVRAFLEENPDALTATPLRR